jgi:hypothetical protein
MDAASGQLRWGRRRGWGYSEEKFFDCVSRRFPQKAKAPA